MKQEILRRQIRGEGKTFFIIDGSSYIYRAFYAIRRLTNSKGIATQAVYGFITMLLKVLRERKPDYICVVFDAPGRTFRHDLSDAYKATRQATPEELVPQIPYIKKAVQYFGIAQMELAGYEADDLIATLTHWAFGTRSRGRSGFGGQGPSSAYRGPGCKAMGPPKRPAFYGKSRSGEVRGAPWANG